MTTHTHTHTFVDVKKNQFIFLMFLFSSIIFSQEREDDELLFTPQGLMEKVYDNEANGFKFSQIVAGQTNQDRNGAAIENTLLCTAGIFELYFEDGSGMENISNSLHNTRRNILCQVFQDVSNFINTPLKNAGNTTKVKIWIRNPNNIIFQNGEYSLGTSYYCLPAISHLNAPNLGGILDGEIWKTIHLGIDSYTNVLFPIVRTENSTGFYHGYLTFNFNTPFITWNYDFNKYNSATGFPVNSKDFYSQALHEVVHALGVISLIDYSGGSLFSPFFPSTFWPYYSRYDTFLRQTNLPITYLITNNPALDGLMYNYSSQSYVALHPNCSSFPPINNVFNSNYFNCSTSINFVGSNVVLPVYTPGCYERHLSFSHFEDACYNGNADNQYFLMSNTSSPTKAKRFLQNEEREILCDIGYSLNGTYGSMGNNTYKNYSSIACAGITVAGLNDGFDANGLFSFVGNSGEEISISNILGNDYTSGLVSNLRFENLQDLSDPNAVFSVTTGSLNTNFTLLSFVPGVHLIRYVPYDVITNKRGNITYLYVNVLNNCEVFGACNLVSNGDFEEYYNLNSSVSSNIHLACGWSFASFRGTADYFNSDTVYNNSIPCNYFGYKQDRLPGNHAYAGMVISEYISESIKTELKSALLPNTDYRLSFDVSRAEMSNQSTRLQAFLSPIDLQLINNGTIPNSSINATTILLTNATFSNQDTESEDGWETISFDFNTGSISNLKFLYLGGLSNIIVQNETPITNTCTGIVGNHTEPYYYIDNVSLTLFDPVLFTLHAVNDDFSSMPINSITGGVTTSVYSNDLYNGNPSGMDNITNVTFSLIGNPSISGATINELGLITIPPNTPVGTYTLTYQIQTIEGCFVEDTATVVIYVSNFILSPPLSSAIRADHSVNLVELQNNGKIIISGNYRRYNNITQYTISRLNTDLTLDTSFSTSGPIPSTQLPLDLDIQTDNKIVLAGWFTGFSGGSNGVGLARLNTNGSLDTSFNQGGSGLNANQGYTSNKSYACAIQNDGKILIGGDFWSYNGIKRLGIVRLNQNGSIDYSFNPIELNNNYYRAVVMEIAVQPNGRILLSGVFSSSLPGIGPKYLIRLNSDGQIDNSFVMGDLTGSTPYGNLGTSLYTYLSCLTLLTDGRIIATGGFTKYNGVTVNNIVRLHSNGSVDSSFITSVGVNRAINSVLIEPSSEKIIVGGEFSTFNGSPVKKLIRLNTNGELDTSFSIGDGTFDPQSSISFFYNSIQTIKKQPDGKVIVGGKFTIFNNMAAGNITRIYGDEGVQARNTSVEYQSEPEIDTNFSDKVVVYPNPSSNNFTFDLTLEKRNFNSLSIYNLIGKNVYNSKIVSKENNLVNLSHLSQGYYLARLESDSESIIIKLIKN